MRRRALAIALAGAGAFGSGCSAGREPSGPAVAEADTLRVLSRNLYLGADVGPVLAAPSPADVPPRVARAWTSVQAARFPERARALAREIAEARPHVIGLQEVALFRVQSPGDATDGGPVAATEVALDYLAILLEALGERGLDYRTAAAVENTDVELPAALAPDRLDDVRYTGRDVVLVREDVSVEGTTSGAFAPGVTPDPPRASPAASTPTWGEDPSRSASIT